MAIIKKDDHLLIIPKDLPNLPRPYERDVYLFSTYVAGTTYVEEIETMVENFSETEIFSFFREPGNPHDELAIAVKNEKQEKIGYLPRADNPVFARLMDAGKYLFGKLKSVQQVGRWYKIELDIYLKD